MGRSHPLDRRVGGHHLFDRVNYELIPGSSIPSPQPPPLPLPHLNMIDAILIRLFNFLWAYAFIPGMKASIPNYISSKLIFQFFFFFSYAKSQAS